MTDLVVVCADVKIQVVIDTLLRRPEALGIGSLTSKVEVMVGRHDPGCYHQSDAYLRPRRREFARALVVFDHDWDGSPTLDAVGMEDAVLARLRPDWGEDCGVVVIEPELEVWVWSDSPRVAAALGWEGRVPSLRDWLNEQGLWPPGVSKPPDPKAAVERAVMKAQRRWTAGICKTLASEVGLSRCQDPSFLRFRALLRRWFPPS